MKTVILALALILSTPVMSACAAMGADTGGDWESPASVVDTSYSPPVVDTSWVDRQNAEDQQRAQQQQEDNQRMWEQIDQQTAQQNLQVFQ